MKNIETQPPSYKKLPNQIECRLPEGENNTVAGVCVSRLTGYVSVRLWTLFSRSLTF